MTTPHPYQARIDHGAAILDCITGLGLNNGESLDALAFVLAHIITYSTDEDRQREQMEKYFLTQLPILIELISELKKEH
jgi:hypothetical protein